MNEYLILDFQKFGLSDKLAVITLQVYLELTEVKKYWDVMYEFKEELKQIVIKAKKSKNDPHLLFLPVSVFEELSFDRLQTILEILKTESIFLAIVHPDSTCVYYQITKDLQEPKDTTAKHKRVDLREKLDSDLKRHRKVLEQAALYGMPVTIVDKEKSPKNGGKEIDKVCVEQQTKTDMT